MWVVQKVSEVLPIIAQTKFRRSLAISSASFVTVTLLKPAFTKIALPPPCPRQLLLVFTAIAKYENREALLHFAFLRRLTTSLYWSLHISLMEASCTSLETIEFAAVRVTPVVVFPLFIFSPAIFQVHTLYVTPDAPGTAALLWLSRATPMVANTTAKLITMTGCLCFESQAVKDDCFFRVLRLGLFVVDLVFAWDGRAIFAIFLPLGLVCFWVIPICIVSIKIRIIQLLQLKPGRTCWKTRCMCWE